MQIGVARAKIIPPPGHMIFGPLWEYTFSIYSLYIVRMAKSDVGVTTNYCGKLAINKNKISFGFGAFFCRFL